MTVRIQQRKVEGSQETISKLQRRKQFPPNEKITSYVTSTTARNRYNKIERFWAVMNRSPKLWDKRFFYFSPRAEGEIDNERMVEAALLAIEIAEKKTLDYPRNWSAYGPRKAQPTGHLFDSIRTFVNGSESMNPLSAISSATSTPIFELVNIAEYGSTAEARAVYVTRQQGLIFYAANRIQRRFPELGIMYRYAKAEDFGLPHVYNVPVLTIGSPEEVNGPWVRPGVNHRKELKRQRRLSNAAARIRKKFE
jgi:hypothetical protein